MSEPTTMLGILHLIEHHAPLRREEIDAIHRLIVAVEEWQIKAKYAYNGTSGDRIALIVEVRDFGKEEGT